MTKQQLEAELIAIKEALAIKSISVNEYQDFYYAISQKLKNIN